MTARRADASSGARTTRPSSGSTHRWAARVIALELESDSRSLESNIRVVTLVSPELDPTRGSVRDQSDAFYDHTGWLLVPNLPHASRPQWNDGTGGNLKEQRPLINACTLESQHSRRKPFGGSEELKGAHH